jgi:hypothetical protein
MKAWTTPTSLIHTGSAYQPFYGDDTVDPFEATQHLPATSLAGPPANVEGQRRRPAFCGACGYALESLDEGCLWCLFTIEEVPSAVDHDLLGAQAGLPQDHQNQDDGNIMEPPISPQAGLPADFYFFEDLPIDLPISSAMSNFAELPVFFQSSLEDLSASFQDDQMWDQILLPDGGLFDAIPEIEAPQQHEEDLPGNQAPLRFERVLDQEFNEINVPVRRRRRLLSRERQEVAAKRGKVCANCRRKKIKVRQIQDVDYSLMPLILW